MPTRVPPAAYAAGVVACGLGTHRCRVVALASGTASGVGPVSNRPGLTLARCSGWVPARPVGNRPHAGGRLETGPTPEAGWKPAPRRRPVGNRPHAAQLSAATRMTRPLPSGLAITAHPWNGPGYFLSGSWTQRTYALFWPARQLFAPPAAYQW